MGIGIYHGSFAVLKYKQLQTHQLNSLGTPLENIRIKWPTLNWLRYPESRDSDRPTRAGTSRFYVLGPLKKRPAKGVCGALIVSF